MSRRGKAATDALRACWRSGDFAGACAELLAHPIPDPATLRRALSAREMGRAIDRPSKPGSESFTHALCLMAIGAKASLALRPDIAQQMRKNGALRLALSYLCKPHRSITGRGHLDDEKLVERAVDALLFLQPEAINLRLVYPRRFGEHYQLFDQHELPIWARAPNLPWRLRQKLIAQARTLKPLDPTAAWNALLEHINAGIRADCLGDLARTARAPSANLFRQGLSLIAQSHYRKSERNSEWGLAERFPLMELLCRSHLDMPDAIEPAAMLGDWTDADSNNTGVGSPSPRRLRFLNVLPKRIDGNLHQIDFERLSSLAALDWFYACSELCARLEVSDLNLLNDQLKSVQAAYMSYHNLRESFESGRAAKPRSAKVYDLAQDIASHQFPTLAPTFSESFNILKSRIEIKAVVSSALIRSVRRQTL